MRQARLRDNSKKERGKRERGKLSLPVKATRILENWIPRKRPTVKLARTSTYTWSGWTGPHHRTRENPLHIAWSKLYVIPFAYYSARTARLDYVR